MTEGDRVIDAMRKQVRTAEDVYAAYSSIEALKTELWEDWKQLQSDVIGLQADLEAVTVERDMLLKRVAAMTRSVTGIDDVLTSVGIEPKPTP
jgi:hypothetical protein